ncbi:DUF6670 family protein [Mycolicibacterium brisbanense]|uniref:Uncharacterized protein n=1 Tax=Mycolicibacterium brisbanense TaxID=146020 RepID=A0A100VYE0_9MYCO|nr:DUF6670 family protein [Mycolicibacterium brisbanense]GAS88302.1 uncharacterized protein RMCB_2398 [Mycolicibacterium brisbanense]
MASALRGRARATVLEQPISHLASRLIVDGLSPRIDRRLPASRLPFDAPAMLRPHAASGLWTATHYGVFVPQLPAPYRYLNTMTLIGATGSELFDNDYLTARDARHAATVLSSTAAGDQHHYRAYDMAADCLFSEDGASLRWGDDLAIDVHYPSVTVCGRYQHFSVDLRLSVTDQVSYFVKTPVYDHLSLLATYSGTIEDASGTTAIDGLGTVEYARLLTHQSLTRRPIPPLLKLPVDFFTYQIVNLDAGTQFLLTDVRARGRIACRLAHLRVLGKTSEVYTNTRMDILDYREAGLIDERGRTMDVPERFRWTVTDDAGAPVLTLDCTIDAPWRYGHGRGYVSAYTFDGRYRGRPVGGSGYVEWVDTQRIRIEPPGDQDW